MVEIEVKIGCPSNFYEQFLLNISGNMNNREKFVEYFFIENVILRVLKKNSSKSVQGFRSYCQNSGQNGVPKHFLRISREHLVEA